jgi:transcriptional regulator with XRE-family HTH domain
MVHPTLKWFGQKIRDIRRQKGISQDDLARMCQLHRNSIGMIERGRKSVTLLNLERIANALDIPLSRLFDTWPDELNPNTAVAAVESDTIADPERQPITDETVPMPTPHTIAS